VPLLPVGAAQAAPWAKPSFTVGDSNVTLVDRRGRRHHHHHHRRGGGPGAAAAIFGGIIAGALIASAIREGRADDRDMRRCEEDFHSFDPRTGTYINRYGEERVCPYLR
jgi:hypothetical protein